MKIRGREWRDMNPKQKHQLLRKKVVENWNKFVGESLILKDKQTFN